MCAIKAAELQLPGLLLACLVSLVHTKQGWVDTFHNRAGAVMESNQFLDMAAFKKLEKMPTKLEMIATIARLLNQVRIIEFSCACVYRSMSSLHGVAYALYCIKWSLDLDRLHLNYCPCPCTMYGTGNRC